MVVFYYIKYIILGIVIRYCDLSGVWYLFSFIDCMNEILMNVLI